MIDGPLYNLSTASKALGKEKNRKLIRALILGKGIKHQRLGRDLVIDQEGFKLLAGAVQEWDSRPRLNQLLAATA